MSALDDKDVPSADEWKAAVAFMTNALRKQILQAEEELHSLEGPTSFYDRWLRWRSQSPTEVGGAWGHMTLVKVSHPLRQALLG